MTDVDETVPLATLSITPQVPGVTAGTGTVNTIPLATLSITPNAPGFQKYPIFEVLDSNGNRIDTITFENLEAGVSSEAQTIILVNNSSSSVDVTLTAALGDNGTLTETVTSTLLSDDGTDYVITTDTFTVPANSSLPVYIKWRPPSTSRPGLKTWTLETSGDTLTPLSGWNYVGSILIDGCYDGALTDYTVDVVVDYIEGVMKDDFGDIRFTLTDETPISYYLESYIEEDTATFKVKIPNIPAKPDDTTILIHSGKSDATTTSNINDVYILYDDATGTYGDNWVDVTGSGSYAMVGGVQAISLNSATTRIRTKNQVTAPFKIEADLYSTAVITAILYCQDSTPATNEGYYARVDVRGSPDGQEGIMVDGSYFTSNVDTFSTPNAWVECVLTLDQNGGHSWTVGGTTPFTGNNTKYTSGYIVLDHHNSGTGAVANFKVSNYTNTPPLVGGIEWNMDYDINLVGGVVYSIPDLPELDLQNHYIINVGGVSYE